MGNNGQICELDPFALKHWPRNYRQHPFAQVERIAASLKQHGQYKNIVVQAGTNRIIAGHGVWEAAKTDGKQTILAMVLDVTDAEAEQILIDDNELSRHAEDDEVQLADLLRDLQDTEYQPAAYTADEIEGLLVSLQPPESPEYNEDIDLEGLDMATCPECGCKFPT